MGVGVGVGAAPWHVHPGEGRGPWVPRSATERGLRCWGLRGCLEGTVRSAQTACTRDPAVRPGRKHRPALGPTWVAQHRLNLPVLPGTAGGGDNVFHRAAGTREPRTSADGCGRPEPPGVKGFLETSSSLNPHTEHHPCFPEEAPGLGGLPRGGLCPEHDSHGYHSHRLRPHHVLHTHHWGGILQ